MLLASLRASLWILSFATIAAAEEARIDSAREMTLKSPDGGFEIRFSLDESGHPRYRVRRSDREIIAWSALGLAFAPGEKDATERQEFRTLEPGERIANDSVWKPVWGERSEILDRYLSATVRFLAADAAAPDLLLEARAYEEGVAFRYLVEPREETGRVRIERELTEFRFVAGHEVWAVTSAQGKYAKRRLGELEHPVERPCVLETGDGQVIAIAEAALVDFARMRLRRSQVLPHTLEAALHGPVEATLPLVTPWRVILAADEPGDLLENNHLLLNLNEPCRIEDTSWIRPGKVIREVTLSTAGSRACVDFAVQNGLQFIELDAGWYGNERDDAADARTVARRDLDLPAVIQYAKEHDIGVILYVNRRHLERQLDELLPLYRSWGIAGIKYGFVQHGSQEWTRWMHDAIRKTAAHEIMVDVHDEYRMTGWQRTYPNFMTAEGIGGDETRPTNEQALANLFTRMIAAPADHTFCYFNGYVDRTTSHASQLAKTVCFFSPWQFLFWYDRPEQASGEPELEFFRHLPTTWDETRVLRSKIGEHAVIVRRKGPDWYLGCLNAVAPRRFEIALDFLDEKTSYEAHIYRDDDSVRTRTKVGVEKRDVDARTALNFDLGERGGLAARFSAK